MSIALTHAPEQVVATLMIAASGLVVAPPTPGNAPTGYPCYFSQEPAGKGTKGVGDNRVTVFDTTDINAVREMVTGTEYTFYGFMVKIRSTSERLGYKLAKALKVWMNEHVYDAAVTVNDPQVGSASYTVQSFVFVKEPNRLGKDPNALGTFLHTVNANVVITAH